MAFAETGEIPGREDYLFREAKQHAARGDIPAAIEIYNDLVTERPKDIDLLLDYASVLTETGERAHIVNALTLQDKALAEAIAQGEALPADSHDPVRQAVKDQKIRVLLAMVDSFARIEEDQSALTYAQHVQKADPHNPGIAFLEKNPNVLIINSVQTTDPKERALLSYQIRLANMHQQQRGIPTQPPPAQQ